MFLLNWSCRNIMGWAAWGDGVFCLTRQVKKIRNSKSENRKQLEIRRSGPLGMQEPVIVQIAGAKCVGNQRISPLEWSQWPGLGQKDCIPQQKCSDFTSYSSVIAHK